MRKPPLRLDDPTKYAVFVLWLHGCSIGRVAVYATKLMGSLVKPDQVRGVLRNSPYYRRGDINERQNHLDILASERLDRGRLKSWAFTAAVLTDGRQK